MQYTIVETLFAFIAVLGVMAVAIMSIIDLFERFGFVGLALLVLASLLVVTSYGIVSVEFKEVESPSTDER